MSKTMILWDKLSHTYDAFKKKKVSVVIEHQLTLPQYHVLEYLHYKGPTALKKMATELLVTPANVTCVVDNLERMELVVRVSDEYDRRVFRAKLTAKGKKKIGKILPEQQKEIETLANLLSDDEQKSLIRLLSKYD